MKRLIGMAGKREWFEIAGRDIDRELFPELSNKCVFRPFSIFDLSSGKLPEPCQ